MTDHDNIGLPGDQVAPEPDSYEPPALSVLGSVEELTLGGAMPVNDMTAGAS